MTIFMMDVGLGIPVPILDGATPSWLPDNAKLVFENVRGDKTKRVDRSLGATQTLAVPGGRHDWSMS